jgi:hypothetical protein
MVVGNASPLFFAAAVSNKKRDLAKAGVKWKSWGPFFAGKDVRQSDGSCGSNKIKNDPLFLAHLVISCAKTTCPSRRMAGRRGDVFPPP